MWPKIGPTWIWMTCKDCMLIWSRLDGRHDHFLTMCGYRTRWWFNYVPSLWRFTSMLTQGIHAVDDRDWRVFHRSSQGAWIGVKSCHHSLPLVFVFATPCEIWTNTLWIHMDTMTSLVKVCWTMIQSRQMIIYYMCCTINLESSSKQTSTRVRAVLEVDLQYMDHIDDLNSINIHNRSLANWWLVLVVYFLSICVLKGIFL